MKRKNKCDGEFGFVQSIVYFFRKFSKAKVSQAKNDIDKSYLGLKATFAREFNSLSDEDLINQFNQGVGVRAYNVYRQARMHAMWDEFNRRAFDYSCIGNENSLSFAHQVILRNNQLQLTSSN